MTRRWSLPLALAALFVIGSAAPASADPIFTPLFTFLLTTAGVSATAVAFGTTTWVSLLSGVASVAFGVGVMMLLTPKPPKPETGQIPIQQPIPARIFAYGRNRIGGATVLAEEVDGTLVRVHTIAGHRILGFVAWYFNDDRITIDGDGHVVGSGGDRRYWYGGNVRVLWRLGLVPETAYSQIVSIMGGGWTSSHRGDGCASFALLCAAVKAKAFSVIYPYGAPQASAVFDGAPIFDPRDPAQSWDDPSTWGASGYDNPALVLIHWECFSPFGTGRDYSSAVLPVLDQWIAEADICDEAMPLKAGGTEKRYTCNFWGDTERHDPRAGRQAILQTCDGWMVERGDGTIVLRVGKYRTPTVTLTDDDIAGWAWQSSPPNAERYELMSARYCSPDNGYSTVETDQRALDNGSLAADQRRVTSLDLAGVQSTGQASRLLKRETLRYAETVRGSLDLRLSALDALYERWIYLDVSIPRLAGRVIENRRPILSITKGRCRLEYIGSGEGIDDYDPTSDESAPPYVPTRPTISGLPIPVVTTAVAEQVSSGSTITTTIDVTIEAPTKNGSDRTDLAYAVRWQRSGSAAWAQSQVDDYTISAHLITLTTDVVATGTSYSVQVAAIAPNGTTGPWCDAVTVSTAPSSTAPTSPGLAVSPGAGVATATIAAPNSANVSAVRLWRAVGGGTFSAASDVAGLKYCTANQTITVADHPAAGSWSYWATAENTYGTASTPTGPVTVTVS